MEFLKKFTKKDLVFSLVTGLATGLIGWRVFLFLGKAEFYSLPLSWLILIIPVVWIIGVNFGYLLGQWVGFFNQFGRYVAVGFTNFSVDAGVLNLLIHLTGKPTGWHYSLFKTVSFIAAVINSYILNKYWVFESGSSGGGRSEMFKFISVNVFALIISVGVASFVVNFVHPLRGFDANTWANVGSVAGSAVAIVFTFVGARLIVFRKVE